MNTYSIINHVFLLGYFVKDTVIRERDLFATMAAALAAKDEKTAAKSNRYDTKGKKRRTTTTTKRGYPVSINTLPKGEKGSRKRKKTSETRRDDAKQRAKEEQQRLQFKLKHELELETKRLQRKKQLEEREETKQWEQDQWERQRIIQQYSKDQNHSTTGTCCRMILILCGRSSLVKCRTVFVGPYKLLLGLGWILSTVK